MGQEIVWTGLQVQASQLKLAFHKLEKIHVFIKHFIYPVLCLLSAIHMVPILPSNTVMQTRKGKTQ